MSDVPIEYPEPVAVDDIVVGANRDPLNEATVLSMMESIKSPIGLLEPVLVRWVPDEGEGHAELVDGLHRLEAYKRLGYRAVPVKQADFDDPTAELAMLESNSVRNQADPATQVLRTNRAMALREKIRADAEERIERERVERSERAVRNAAAFDALGPGESDSSAATVREARRTGESVRTIQLRKEWGEKIDPDLWVTIVAHPELNKVRFFKALARLPVEEQTAFMEQTLANGGKFADPPHELRALQRAWKAASAEAREEFLREVAP